jgi:predicted acetyltransferase
VLPRYRGRGVATEVIRQIVLDLPQPWLICVFREDRQALDFWRRAFERLPFSSVREVLPSEDPDLHEFIVNDVATDAVGAAAAGGTACARSA